MTARNVFREEVLQNAQAAVFIGSTPALTGPTWTQWFVAGSKTNQNVLGFILEFSNILTATASQAAVASTSLIDEGLDQLQVSADPTQDPRIYITSSRAAQELEKLAFDLGTLTYPRATPSNFTASGTRTDTVQLWVPAGGPVAAIRIHIPNITGVFAASVTGTVQVNVRAIYGQASTVVAAKETNGSAVSGKQDIVNLNLIPADISPDYVDFINTYEAGNADGITQAQAYGPDGDLLIDVDTAASVLNLQNIYPDQYGLQNTEYGTNLYTTILALRGQRPKKFTATFGTTYTPDVLWVQFVAGVNVAPSPQPSPTPVAAAVTETKATSPVARVAAGLGVGPRRMQ